MAMVGAFNDDGENSSRELLDSSTSLYSEEDELYEEDETSGEKSDVDDKHRSDRARDNFRSSSVKDYDDLHRSNHSQSSHRSSRRTRDDSTHSRHRREGLSSSTHSRSRRTKSSSSARSKSSHRRRGEDRSSRSSRSHSRRVDSHSPNGRSGGRSRRSSSRRSRKDRRSPTGKSRSGEISRTKSNESLMKRSGSRGEIRKGLGHYTSADDLLSARLSRSTSNRHATNTNESWDTKRQATKPSQNPLLVNSLKGSHHSRTADGRLPSARGMRYCGSANDLMRAKLNPSLASRRNEVKSFMQEAREQAHLSKKASLGAEQLLLGTESSSSSRVGLRGSSSNNDLSSAKLSRRSVKIANSSNNLMLLYGVQHQDNCRGQVPLSSRATLGTQSSQGLRRCASSGNSLSARRQVQNSAVHQSIKNASWQQTGAKPVGRLARSSGLRSHSSSNNILLDKMHSRNDGGTRQDVWDPFNDTESQQGNKNSINSSLSSVSHRVGLRRLGSGKNLVSQNPFLKDWNPVGTVQPQHPRSCGDDSVDDPLWRDAKNNILLNTSMQFEHDETAPTHNISCSRTMESAVAAETFQRLNGVDNILLDLKNRGQTQDESQKPESQADLGQSILTSVGSSSNITAMKALCQVEPGYAQIQSPKKNAVTFAKLTAFAPSLFQGTKKEEETKVGVSYKPGTKCETSLADRVAEVVAKPACNAYYGPQVEGMHESASSFLHLDATDNRPQTSWELSA